MQCMHCKHSARKEVAKKQETAGEKGALPADFLGIPSPPMCLQCLQCMHCKQLGQNEAARKRANTNARRQRSFEPEGWEHCTSASAKCTACLWPSCSICSRQLKPSDTMSVPGAAASTA